jgi:hypothetical protein
MNVQSDTHIPLWFVQHTERDSSDSDKELLQTVKKEISDSTWNAIQSKDNDSIVWIPGTTVTARVSCTHGDSEVLVPAVFNCTFDHVIPEYKSDSKSALPSMSEAAHNAVHAKLKGEHCPTCK